MVAENGVETGPYNDPPINMETLTVLPTARAPSHQPITPQPYYNNCYACCVNNIHVNIHFNVNYINYILKNTLHFLVQLPREC